MKPCLAILLIRVNTNTAQQQKPYEYIIGVIPSPEWLLPGEAEVGVGSSIVDGNGGAVDLITPPPKVTECVDGETNVSLECQRVHRPRVYAL